MPKSKTRSRRSSAKKEKNSRYAQLTYKEIKGRLKEPIDHVFDEVVKLNLRISDLKKAVDTVTFRRY
jgi:hypothetical protein